MRKTTLVTAICAALLPAVNGYAGEREDLVQLRATTLNLIEMLVKEGVLSQEGADRLMAQAKQQAAEEVQAAERAEAKQATEGGENVVRVGYVPKFVRDEIREQVRMELREDVTNDVLTQAKNEAWGVPGTQPDWTQRIKISGDMRLRAQGDLYSSDNLPYASAKVGFLDFNQINDHTSTYLNTDQNRYRSRLRLRLGIDGKVTSNVTAGVRIASGNTNDPVSTNQTLGNNFQPSDVILDRAFLKYDGLNDDGYENLTLWGGRMPNPWLSTDLVWDDDLNFEGVAGTYRWNLSRSGGGLLDLDERNRTLYLTLGGFSLDEVQLSASDKTLFAAQLGTQWISQADQSSLDVAVAYYGYNNVAGRKNSLGSTLYNYTAPGFVQKGNSMFEISNDPAEPQLFGLASDFKLLDLTFKYDLARFAPTHFILSGDYVRNIGYDAGKIRDRLEGNVMYVDSTNAFSDPSDKQNEGYQLKLAFGWPSALLRRNWQAFIAYKYLERDAVLDAFTDSDFHLGGTNAKGWMLGGSYGLTDNVYLSARYMSAEAIDGPPLGIDILQVDLNAKF